MWKFSDCYVNEFLCVSREASEVNLTITMPDCKCRPHIVIGLYPQLDYWNVPAGLYRIIWFICG